MPVTITRARTAIYRQDASRPVRLALDHGLITQDVSVFDYGCGHGADVNYLSEQGVTCTGWDPAHRDSDPMIEADLVNLGYVINVIESEPERAATLRTAWSLARRVLVVSARLRHERDAAGGVPHQDGIVTGRGTFQKFFEQHELQMWVQSILGVEAVPAAPGVFYVFRSPTDREGFVASRFRRRSGQPRLKRSETLYLENQEALRSLLAFMDDHGRPPGDGELGGFAEAIEAFGSVRRAVSVVARALGTEQWANASKRSREDLLVYLALSKFGRRLRFSELPVLTRNDVKFHCRTYSRACEDADALLFGTGNSELVEAAMTSAGIGKLTPTAFYIHADWLDTLPPLLRVYEGCARMLLGEVSDTQIIKLSRLKFQVSYLTYPEFDKDPHPALARSIVVRLQGPDVDYRFYDRSPNPPVLHRKETFLSSTDARYERFQRLTEQEERWNLLEESSVIGTRDGWNERLAQYGCRMSGHRVVHVR